jgi:hypothetical protein
MGPFRLSEEETPIMQWNRLERCAGPSGPAPLCALRGGFDPPLRIRVLRYPHAPRPAPLCALGGGFDPPLRNARHALAIVAATAVLAVPCHAQTRIFLGEYKFEDPRLYVMNPGGTNVEELDIIPDADWLVVGLQVDPDAGTIYWTHGGFNQGRIRRASLDGTGMTTIVSGLTNPRGLALDLAGGHLYWSDTQDLRMYRVPVGGGAVQTVIDTGHQLGRPTLVPSEDALYFGNYGTGEIRRSSLDGMGQEVILDGLFTPVAIAIDQPGQKIYWADSNTSFVSNHIARADLDGTDVEILYTGLPTSSGFTGIALDLTADRLYWSDEITAAEKGVWEAALDGSDAARVFESPRGWNAGAMTIVEDTCPTDLADPSGETGFADLLVVLSTWGACVGCPADLDADGVVGFADLLILLAEWGPCRS